MRIRLRPALARAMTVVLVGLCSAASLATPQETPFGRYFALVIGNDDYQSLPRLKTAVADAEAVAKTLGAKYGFEVRLLRNATRADILRAMNDYRAELTEKDNLLIYYAGHGYVDIVTDTGFWQPIDAEEDDDLNWIANEDLTRRLNAMSAQHVLVIADSCYSGTLVRSSTGEIPTGHEREAWLQRMAERRSRTAIVSGGIEPVADSGRGGHSVFANALLDALQANKDVIVGSSLFKEVSRPVVVNAVQTPQYSDIRMAGHEGGEFIFVPIIVAPTIAAAESKTAPAGADKAVEVAFWQGIQESQRPADFEAYLQQFPNGVFAPLARGRLAALQEQTKVGGAKRLAGRWRSEVLINPFDKNDWYRIEFEFKILGERVLRSMTHRATADSPSTFRTAATRPIIDGKLEGTALSFSESFEVLMGSKREDHARHYVGELGADGLRFFVQDTLNNPPLEFTATRVEVE
jgi:uncharacterized caspase-like protein